MNAINLLYLMIYRERLSQMLFSFNTKTKIITANLFQGAVPKGNATKETIQQMGLCGDQVVYKCPKCCCIKPERAHHCSVCQRCIRKMDHHCPWVNNCVGEKNQKYFVLFTVIFLNVLFCVRFVKYYAVSYVMYYFHSWNLKTDILLFLTIL